MISEAHMESGTLVYWSLPLPDRFKPLEEKIYIQLFLKKLPPLKKVSHY